MVRARGDSRAPARSVQAPGGADVRRCFVAIWPDDSARSALAALAARCAQGQGRAQAVAPVNLHLTLAFIGDLAREAGDALAGRIARMHEKSGDFVLDRIGYFAKPRVIWAGTGETPALEALSDSVRRVLAGSGVPFDAKRFAAHVTLLRHAAALPGPAPQVDIAWPNSAPDLAYSERDPTGRLIYRSWSPTAPGQDDGLAGNGA